MSSQLEVFTTNNTTQNISHDKSNTSDICHQQIHKVAYTIEQRQRERDCVNITIDGSTYNAISNNAFEDCDTLTIVTIEEGIESIGVKAFKNCISLKSVVLPNSLKHIAESAFENCESLTSITLPDGITELPNSVFRDCVLLETIKLPSHLISIGDFAFANSGISSLMIPEGVESIGMFAFCSCNEIKQIKLPNSVTNIGYGAFQTCSQMVSINIPERIITLAPLTFEGCLALEKVDMSKSKSLETIGFYCFNLCSICKLQLPPSLKYIEHGAFSECMNIRSLTIPNNVVRISSYAFANCVLLNNIVLPKSIKSIGARAFDGCLSLSSVNMPNDTKIGYKAFDENTNITLINTTNMKSVGCKEHMEIPIEMFREGLDVSLSIDGKVFKTLKDAAKGDSITYGEIWYYTNNVFVVLDYGNVHATEIFKYDKDTHNLSKLDKIVDCSIMEKQYITETKLSIIDLKQIIDDMNCIKYDKDDIQRHLDNIALLKKINNEIAKLEKKSVSMTNDAEEGIYDDCDGDEC